MNAAGNQSQKFNLHAVKPVMKSIELKQAPKVPASNKKKVTKKVKELHALNETDPCMYTSVVETNMSQVVVTQHNSSMAKTSKHKVIRNAYLL